MLKTDACHLLLDAARKIEAAPMRFNPYRWDADIAAFICMSAGFHPLRDRNSIAHVHGIPVGDTAADLIGVPFEGKMPRFHSLFFAQDWAEPYRAMMKKARTNEERANVAAAYIRYFINRA